MQDAAVLPAGLVDRFKGARRIVEVGVGNRFEWALEWRRLLPGCEVHVTDLRQGLVEGNPPGTFAHVDDVTSPDGDLYLGAALLYSVRMPEELQVHAAILAKRVGAAFALSPLGSEVVDLTAFFPHVERFASTGRAWWLFSRPGGPAVSPAAHASSPPP